MNFYEITEEMTNKEDFVEFVQQIQRAPRIYRVRVNHFTKWNDAEFKQRFRLSMPIARYIINKISGRNMPSQRYHMHALSAEEMILTTLSFLATGSFLRVIRDLSELDKSTISRTI
jgi:hypothetical protein